MNTNFALSFAVRVHGPRTWCAISLEADNPFLVISKKSEVPFLLYLHSILSGNRDLSDLIRKNPDYAPILRMLEQAIENANLAQFSEIHFPDTRTARFCFQVIVPVPVLANA
jgi:hypothetical protein